MRFSSALSQALYGASAVAAASIPEKRETKAASAPALPLSSFGTMKTFTLEQIKQGADLVGKNWTGTTAATSEQNSFKSASAENNLVTVSATAAASCTNPNVRFEWRSYSDSDRLAFVNAIKCLMNKPSAGGFGASQNRYEDLVYVHQQYTPNIHGNSKFLIWHRYYVWTFEQIMRDECAFDRAFPWWDETLDAGNFAASSIFTDAYFGSLPRSNNGQAVCVTNGKFAGTTLHIGPGSGNVNHCLARSVDESLTAQCNSGFVNTCNSRTSYADMASCAEGGPHAYGHNGIGAVMSDVYASPSDPVFFLHHLFVDRNFRIWQNADSARKTSINGCVDQNSPCTPLTMDTWVYMHNLRPNVQVKDILDTMNGVMCYRYTY